MGHLNDSLFMVVVNRKFGLNSDDNNLAGNTYKCTELLLDVSPPPFFRLTDDALDGFSLKQTSKLRQAARSKV